jgi:hypothetical protein
VDDWRRLAADTTAVRLAGALGLAPAAAEEGSGTAPSPTP